LVNEAIVAYVEFSNALRLAILPGWFTAELTISQVKALFLLAHHGSLTVGELAKLLGIGNPAASILVQQLVEQSVATRTVDLQDRRRTLVTLTDAGRKLMGGRREQVEAMLTQWLSRLPDDELANLLRSLNALVAIVRDEQTKTDSPTERQAK
jgi:DNA-binding MarR family transcriptional regulator